MRMSRQFSFAQTSIYVTTLTPTYGTNTSTTPVEKTKRDNYFLSPFCCRNLTAASGVSAVALARVVETEWFHIEL